MSEEFFGWIITKKGGPESGNHGHAGIPGHLGGSAPSKGSGISNSTSEEKVVKSVKEVFEGLIENLRDGARKEIQQGYDKIKQELMQFDGKIMEEYDKYRRKQWVGQREKQRIASYLIHPKNGALFWSSIMEMSPKADEYIKGWVEKDLSAMFDSFVSKQVKKTNDIVKGRTLKATGKVSSNLESKVNFELGDGAKFEMRTKIVWKFSNKGTNFWQFPTTFHNAVKANGEEIKTPSEAKLKAEL